MLTLLGPNAVPPVVEKAVPPLLATTTFWPLAETATATSEPFTPTWRTTPGWKRAGRRALRGPAGAGTSAAEGRDNRRRSRSAWAASPSRSKRAERAIACASSARLGFAPGASVASNRTRSAPAAIAVVTWSAISGSAAPSPCPRGTGAR